jgi:GH24 family phage-related lysozyme (muramidase)
MKGKFEHKESRGLPGGPNEQFTYVTGMFSVDGYKADSPDVNNPFNVIPSGNITMKGVDFPVIGTDNLGNTKLMKPGKDYKFPGDMVFEVPMAQRGGQMNEEGQKQRNWFDSYIRSDKYLERLGKEMTGFMPGAYDANKVANERRARLMNLRNTPVRFLPESSDISPTPGDVQGVYDADEYPGMIMLRPEYSKGRQGPWSYNTIPLHEMGHAADEGGKRIPQPTKDLLMSTLKDNDLGIPKEEYYYTQPTEYINRLQPLRYLLQEEGIYDARTEDFTEKHLQKAKENTRIELNKHFQDLLRNTKSEKDLINLMNIIAMDEQGQALPTAQFGGATTQDSLALYNNAILKAKFYEQNVGDGEFDYKPYYSDRLVQSGFIDNENIEEVFKNFNPDYANRRARNLYNTFPDNDGPIKMGSLDDRNKVINKDLIQVGDLFGTHGVNTIYREDAPPVLLHRNIKPDKWKFYRSNADNDASVFPVYDPVKVYPKSQGPVPKEAYKYSDIEEPKEFSRYVNIHGNNYGFDTAEEFIDIARRKNLPQGWIDANIPKDLESQTKGLIAKLQTGGEYTVKSGDTFDGIANKLASSLGVSKDQFIKANPGIRGRTLQINQTLNVPISEPKEYKTFAGKLAMENLFAPGKPFYDTFSYEMFKPATELIKQREGFTEKKGKRSYIDSEGKLTGGIGHLLTEAEKRKYPKGTSIPQEQVNRWFEQDTKKFYNAAIEQAEEIGNTDERLINALASVNFQLGKNWYKEHKNTWKLLKEGKYNEAAKEAADSNWYKQTPVRVKDFQKTLMEIPNIKRQGGEVEELELYKSYINSDFDNKADQIEAQKVYDKLNRIHYKNAKQFGMSAPNYIMTYLLKNPNG